MKKTLLIMVMALAVLLTQCRKPEVKFPSPVAPEGTTVSMTVTAGPGSKTDITTAGGITWSTGDKLYVGDGTHYVGYLTIVSGQNTPTGTFSGDVMLPTGTTDEKTFHFFYLGSGDYTSLTKGISTSVDVDFSSQEIYADVNNKLVNASAQHVGYGSAKGTVTDGVVTGINVTLVSKVALAHFSFTESDSKNDYTGALMLGGEHIYNKMTVSFGSSEGFAFTPAQGYISLTNTTSAEKYVMLVPTGSTEAETLNFVVGATGTTTLENGIESNKFYGRESAIGVTVKPVEFTVDKYEGTTVEFAPGNLYYNGEDDNKMNDALPSGWNFYEHQWDCYPSGTSSVTEKNEISLFTWGYGDWSTVYNTEGYEESNTMTDWGTAPGLPSAGDGKTWRTLTNDEWKNLLGIEGGPSLRDNAASLRAMVTLTDVNVYGLVILPDGSTVTASDVTTTDLVASSGAVFLPAAGYRLGLDMVRAGSYGYYWSGTPLEGIEDYAYHIYFNSGGVIVSSDLRNFGYSVRLVR